MLILTERTPNPDAMKFVPDRPLTVGDGRPFARGCFEPGQSPLAARLFALPDIDAVFVARDFVTVTRSAAGRPWNDLRFAALAAIADHLESGLAALPPQAAPDRGACPAAPGDPSSDEIEAEIRSVLGLWVKPGVSRDGGDILFDRFDPQTGVLWIRMLGACGGCPSSRLTLKSGVERIVRRYVPEVLRVEDAAAETGGPRPSRLAGWLASLPARTGPPRRPVFTHAGVEISVRGGEADACP